MSFKFLNQVLYEQLRQYTKDLFVLTGSFPSYESSGLIPQIRNLGTSLLEDFAESSTRFSESDVPKTLEKCILSIAKITALLDLSFQLKYVNQTTHHKWILASEDLTRRLYDTRKESK
ncbi:MAG: hypothetical protein A2184_02375 [Candidatus Moranbacteria bacterium RIFOXYA1_FULL_44_7]|uniref:Four helix bundle protein n=1 Tax=Candidatus Amesbacteria bacterium RIFOXYB1_FULL_44_23 TaxID=1797263 RepID=A0A1F4ZSN1_9BACT|nr:MAG: hypothetical protein A2397_02070 [Candidatus Amesbacteria bacterium RIFOXYB1_FULL_44_23]OGI27022.1 MAG: hypothetical protein A2184_02375 [Candidatus Moranbacteria bacterium RIFOXYA1_FULL_44_7]